MGDRGILEGDSVPDLCIPRLLDLYAQGRFPLNRLVAFYDLDQINQAVTDAAQGTVLQPVLRMHRHPVSSA